jgi:hypothetical protein
MIAESKYVVLFDVNVFVLQDQTFGLTSTAEGQRHPWAPGLHGSRRRTSEPPRSLTDQPNRAGFHWPSKLPSRAEVAECASERWTAGEISAPAVGSAACFITAIECCEAIEAGNGQLVAQYLREATFVDMRIRIKLANLLKRPFAAGRWLELKAGRGRPTKRLFRPLLAMDFIALAIDDNDIDRISEHLSGATPLDRRIIDWLIARLDPKSEQGPHFRFRDRKPRGRKFEAGKTETLMAGKAVEEKFSQLGGHQGRRVLNQAVQAVNVDRKKNGKTSLSRSEARRARRFWLESKND